MIDNRTQRMKKFLELAIQGSFYRRKSSSMHVDKHHVLQQLYSVSVDFQQLEGGISSIKEDLTESFHLERRRI